MFQVLADCGDSTIAQWAFSEAAPDRETQGYRDGEAELSQALNMSDKRERREKAEDFLWRVSSVSDGFV